MKYNSVKIGERIRMLRKNLGYTQDEMIEKIRDKTSIGRNTYIALEKGNIGNCKFEQLLALCDLFSCDIGYLLGEYDSSTKEIEDIHDVTGLSEKAIANLCTYNDPNIASFHAVAHGYTQAIDFLLSHPHIERLLIPLEVALKWKKASDQFDLDESIASYENRHGKETVIDYCEAEEFIASVGNVILPIGDAVRFYSQLAAHELQTIISETIEHNKPANKKSSRKQDLTQEKITGSR